MIYEDFVNEVHFIEKFFGQPAIYINMETGEDELTRLIPDWHSKSFLQDRQVHITVDEVPCRIIKVRSKTPIFVGAYFN